MSERMDFAGGKYTVINDNGNLTALRHGEPWKRDLTGDNLVYWMLIEALELKSQRDELLKALRSVWLWMEDQADGQSKGGHATFDLMLLREQRDISCAAIAKAGGEA